MECCSIGLAELVKHAGLGEGEIRNYSQQLLAAVKALAAIDIIHRDIKPDNCLISGPHLKLADFGLADKCPQEGLYHSVGTPQYMAPELVWAGRKTSLDGYGFNVATVRWYNCTADLWSVGCVIFFMVCTYPPFFLKWKVNAASWEKGDAVYARCERDGQWYEGVVTAVTWKGCHPEVCVAFDGFEDGLQEWKHPECEGDHYEVEKRAVDGERERGEGGWLDYDGMYEDMLKGQYGGYDFKCAGWEEVDKAVQGLVNQLLEVDPAARLTAEQALDMPWFNSTTSRAGPAQGNVDDGDDDIVEMCDPSTLDDHPDKGQASEKKDHSKRKKTRAQAAVQDPSPSSPGVLSQVDGNVHSNVKKKKKKVQSEDVEPREQLSDKQHPAVF